jgi:hypothetical protein
LVTLEDAGITAVGTISNTPETVAAMKERN